MTNPEAPRFSLTSWGAALRRSPRIRRVLALVAVELLAGSVLLAEPKLALLLESLPSEVVILGAAPGSGWFLLGQSRARFEPTESSRSFEHAQLVDGDADGVLSYLPKSGGVPALSSWVALQVADGLLLSSSTLDGLIPEEFAPGTIEAYDDLHVAVTGADLTVVLLRPGLGAWIWNGKPTAVISPDDPDQLRYLVPISELEGTGGPEIRLMEFRSGDVLVALDQRFLSVRSVTLK